MNPEFPFYNLALFLPNYGACFKHSFFSLKRCRPHLRRRSHLLRLLSCLFFISCMLLLLKLSLFSSDQLRRIELADWGFKTSRNIVDYMHPKYDTTLLQPLEACQERVKNFVMIMVWSGVKNFEVREAIRKTWGNTKEFNYHLFAQIHKHLKYQYLEASEERMVFYAEYLKFTPKEPSIENGTIPVRVIFVVGRSRGETIDDELLDMYLRYEAASYQDILQGNFVDTYNNLTLKSVFALKWVTQHCLQKCAYILKCDDDTFVNVPNLLHYLLGGTIPLYNNTIYLQNWSSSKMLAASYPLNETRNFLAGQVLSNIRPDANVTSKWYMPYYMYPNTVYPNFLSGASYIMSVDVAPQLYKAALKTNIIHLEDVYITGLCAEKAALKLIHQPLFMVSNSRQLCCLKGSITQHYVDRKGMLKAYDFVTDLKMLCAPPSFIL